ncbi:hypothetical protein LSH36_180g03009 [Paralvinella palmiformis]|uniref:C2H2-type domain-containing protein n=1 Tax=Paralvinella palmiformis TaxID=53620 RepID=A0AAD9JTL1_9ANNE|nr:hypothetical protein LSH36_180g03009 [Paralvinella palmiformis]
MESFDLSLAFDREHLQRLLISSLKNLFLTKVSFKSTLSIEGLVGLTVDDTTVQLISIKEVLHNCVGSRDSSLSKPGLDPGCLLKLSSSRRKSKVTRRAVINSENDCGSDLNDDWNTDSVDNGLMDNQCELPLNLVKCENNNWPIMDCENHVRVPSSPATEVKVKQKESLVYDGDVSGSRSEMSESPVSGTELLTTSKHTWNYPTGNVRKYGSYGYVINHGSDVMFSCNQCPKMFRNRVSLWRHGVKHKTSQGLATSKVMSSNKGMVYCQPSGMQQQYSVSSLGKATSSPLEVRNNHLTFHSNHVKSFDGSRDVEKSANVTIPLYLKTPDTLVSRQENGQVTQCDGAALSSGCMNSDAVTESSEMNNNDSESNLEKSPNSSSSVTEENMELDAHIPGNTGNDVPCQDTTENPMCDAVKAEVDNSASRECEHSTKAISKSDVKASLLPTLSGNESNLRLISGYGYVVDTANGKLYKCISCLKSFKNRVSLWKHQLKHQ